MSGFYEEMIEVVSGLLSPDADPPGGTITMHDVSVPTYDPATGTATATTSDVTRKGMLFDFGPGQVNGPGGLIQGGDKRCIMEAGVVPKLEDRITVNGVMYIIKGIGEVNPAGTPVLYDLHLRA